MCGLVGFPGKRQAAPILLDGLSKLEYRGYDSAGLAVRDGEALAQVVKAKGRLSNLIEKTDAGNALKGTCGIGHTRWALVLVNVIGSSIAREADKVFYTLAGPEISVATTKAYSAQLAAMYCLAVQFAKVREKITEEQYSYYISELLTIPEKMQKTATSTPRPTLRVS